jgi:hypothetical protein
MCRRVESYWRELFALSRVDTRQQAVSEAWIRREVALSGNENEKTLGTL